MTEGSKARNGRIAGVLADWGTTKLRLWLWYGRQDTSAPVDDPRGMKALGPNDYPEVLESGLAALGAPPGVPVVVCGMAGARGGWRDAGYLDVPTGLDRLSDRAVRVEGVGRDVRILPGACMTDPASEVMRGEETQLAGLIGTGAPNLVCLPGTHSKWATLQNGVLERFNTFMTGEIFAVLSDHSILSRTLDDGWDPAVFADAVAEAVATPQNVWRAFFGLRADAVLEAGRWASARARLSGLLIGAECASARDIYGGEPVALVAGGRMGESYAWALEAAGFAPELHDGETITRRGLACAATEIWGD